jgi:hypothetical protein
MEDTNFSNVQPEVARFSKLSIAALAISIVGLLLFCVAIAIAFSLGFTGQGQQIDQNSPTFVTATVLMCGGVLVNLLGAGLSIGSLFVAQRSKALSITGIVVAALVVCSFAALAVFGLLMA